MVITVKTAFSNNHSENLMKKSAKRNIIDHENDVLPNLMSQRLTKWFLTNDDKQIVKSKK